MCCILALSWVWKAGSGIPHHLLRGPVWAGAFWPPFWIPFRRPSFTSQLFEPWRNTPTAGSPSAEIEDSSLHDYLSIPGIRAKATCAAQTQKTAEMAAVRFASSAIPPSPPRHPLQLRCWGRADFLRPEGFLGRASHCGASRCESVGEEQHWGEMWCEVGENSVRYRVNWSLP